MKDEDIRNLLGGFATDTLTESERELLFGAALHDQELVNALADDQALRECLADPSMRRLEMLGPPRLHPLQGPRWRPRTGSSSPSSTSTPPTQRQKKPIRRARMSVRKPRTCSRASLIPAATPSSTTSRLTKLYR